MIHESHLDEEDFCEDCGLRLEFCECQDEYCHECGKHAMVCDCEEEDEAEVDECPLCGMDVYDCICCHEEEDLESFDEEEF